MEMQKRLDRSTMRDRADEFAKLVGLGVLDDRTHWAWATS
jgi:hypothetical protein